ncbi:FixH family protein [Woodsholea maritima]|uniref:FixH family protein n=1 Tax=Woodsholea maritima TaxID=240237 RepID=UPI0003829930|nr:FixH family protein [Woodsholea maritima]
MIKEVKGYHVLIVIMCFFGVTIAVNATFVTLALKTFSGEDVERSYLQGVDYNDVLARRRAQAELGWRAEFEVSGSEILIAVQDREGHPVEGLMLQGRLRHPTNSHHDQALSFQPAGQGLYSAAFDPSLVGSWRLVAHSADEAPFELEHALWLN